MQGTSLYSQGQFQEAVGRAMVHFALLPVWSKYQAPEHHRLMRDVEVCFGTDATRTTAVTVWVGHVHNNKNVHVSLGQSN